VAAPLVRLMRQSRDVPLPLSPPEFPRALSAGEVRALKSRPEIDA